MKVRLLKVSLAVVIGLFSSSCQVVFTNPPAAKPREDKTLRGRWTSEEKEKEAMAVQFEKGNSGEVNVSFPRAGPDDKNPVFTAKLFEIGGRSYMVLNPTDEDRNKGFLIIRYEISGDELAVWIPNSEKVALIKQKRISGEDGQFGATVTESADNVSWFLQSRDGQDAFEVFGKFKRARR